MAEGHLTVPSHDAPSPSPAPSSIHSASKEKEKQNEPEPFNPPRTLYWAFAALAVVTLMVALDGTSISVALPIIARKLDGTAIEAFWAGTSFLLASTVIQPSFASLSHIFGRMPVLMVSLTLFLIGVLTAGLAHDFTVLLIGRTIQGVGGGGIFTITEILVTDLVPLRYRGQWVGILAAMWSIGSVSGPLIGGAFAAVQWRWILWINLPFIGIAFVMVPLFIRLNAIPSSIASKLRRFDWIGSVVFVASMTSFLIPVTWGGIMYSWTSWRTLVPMIIGIAGLAGFWVFEKYVAPEPIIRLSIFANRSANIAFINTALHGMILWCLLYYQPLYYEAVKGYSPIISGVALFPSTFTVAPMAVVTGLLITKTGKYRWTLWLGWAITTVGFGLDVLLKVNSTIPQWIFINLVGGVGMGILFPGLQFQLQAASDAKEVSFAVAMFVFFRSFGQAVGVAVGGVIFQNQMVKHLSSSSIFTFDSARAHELAKDAAGLVEVIKATPQGSEKLALQTAYTDSLRTVYIVLCALSALALGLSLVTKSYDMNVGLETEQSLMASTKKSKEDTLEEGQGGQ